MLEKMLCKVVNQMEAEQIIDYELREHYIYALVTMVERWITVGSILIISFISKNFIPTIFFLISFFSLRKRTGGYHAEKFWQCYIGTVVTYILVILICPILNDNRNVMYILVLLAAIIISIIGTVNHPNIAMNEMELKESKKTARLIIALECLLVYVFVKLNINGICVCYMSVAIILCAVLLCIAKLLRQEVTK